MSVGATTTNSAVGVILTLSTTITYGGSVLLFYGFSAMALVGLCTAISLGELASAYPDAGGQYVWTARLAPPKYRRFLSYVTGLLSWAGAVCTGGSTCVIAPMMLFQLVTFFNPDFENKPWMAFLGYQAVTIVTLLPSLFESLLPKVSKSLLAFTGCLLLTFFISLLSASDHMQTPEDFFTRFYNASGWNSGIAVLIGINSLNWCFSCLDAIVHLSDEIPRPQNNIPKALIWSIAVGFVTGLMIIFAFGFNATDYEMENSSVSITYYAIKLFSVHFYHRSSMGHSPLASRLAWTIGINKGLPLHKHLSKDAPPPYNTAVWALIFSASWTRLLGCLYLASTAAFSSFTAAGILFQYTSYVVPIILMNIRGRSNIPHGPFWFPRIGVLANIVLCCWFLVALVFYCFPYTSPVFMSEMNWVFAVIPAALTLILLCWFGYGRRNFSFPELEIIEGERNDGYQPRPTACNAGKV
ncbi:amino acid/polyamine transporter I [Fusarium oxysporum f. sp. albedinis]|nr:amino acid/polyamine transporter I [Fusarium oxysporum f. sp. albedinis]